MSYSPFQFSSPVVICSEFRMIRPAREEDDVKVHLIRNISREETGKKQAIVEITVQLNKKQEKEREDACFVAAVTLQSIFLWDDSIEDEKVDKLLEINAPALLVSYARPLLSQLTECAPIPTYHLPFINMEELFSHDEH